MAKNSFSSAVESSLIGRTAEEMAPAPKTVEIEAKASTKREEPVEEKAVQKQTPKKSKTLDLDEMFPENKVEKMGNRSFYISDDVYAKLESFAKKKGVSSSKVVNDLLKTCL